MNTKIKNIKITKNTNLIKKVHQKLTRNKYDTYIIPLGLIDYHLDEINNRIKTEYNQYDCWAQDMQSYKKQYENIRNIISEEALLKLKPTSKIKEAIETYPSHNLTKDFSVEDLQEEKNLDFCLSYQRGYKSGSLIEADILKQIYSPVPKIKKR